MCGKRQDLGDWIVYERSRSDGFEQMERSKPIGICIDDGKRQVVNVVTWEQRKLGDVVEDYVEKTTVEDQYPVLASSQQKGIVLQDDYFSGERVSQNGNIGYFVILRGYFTFQSRRDNDVFVFNRNDAVDMGIISYFYPVFKPKGVNSDFLLCRLNYGLEDQIKINSEGTGQHVLSLKKFKNIVGVFPSYEEQKNRILFFPDRPPYHPSSA